MRYSVLMLAGLLLSDSAHAGIVPDDYKARIEKEIEATRELATVGTYTIRFSSPAYAAVKDGRNGSSAQIVGAVRFLLFWAPPTNAGSIHNMGFVPEIAEFDGNGQPTFVSDVDWLWGIPKLGDIKMAEAFPFSSRQQK
jgi:hypothetical protein